MARMRVYEVARELGLENKVVIAHFNDLGVEVKSHANAVSEDDFARLRAHLAGNGEAGDAVAETVVADEGASDADAVAADEETEPAAEPAEVADDAEESADADGGAPADAAEADEAPSADAVVEDEPAPKVEVMIEDGISVGELARRLEMSPAKLIGALMAQGIMANVTQALDAAAAAGIAEAQGFAVRIVRQDEALLGDVVAGDPADLVERAPVVTIMGHVDHGKTQLLDSIRETNVVAREAGGITQHIGASEVEWNGHRIIFIDTPGHEAFTRMRARGAEVTDLVILVVAADDGVMPQTVEAIDHARAADVPILVAINKTDLPTANPDRVKQQLAERELAPEDWGGQTVCVMVSAKTKDNLDELLEYIILSAELLELKANPKVPARGIVLEAELDRRRGAVATLLVQEGTLEIGQSVIAGSESARVRAMTNPLGDQVKEAGPATAVEVLGFSGVPEAGDAFQRVEEAAVARQVAEMRQEQQRRESLGSGTRLSLEDLHERIREGEVVKVPVVLKADTQGSVQTLRDALLKLSGDKVKVEIIHDAVGGVTEMDVLLASTSGAIIVGFNVRPERGVADAASHEGVDLRLYTVIYQLIDEIKQAMVGKLEPTYEEKALGAAEIRDTFKIPRAGTIAGCYVTDGKFTRSSRVRLLRDSRIIYEGKVGSLRRFKDDVREVQQGYECGIGLENFNDVKVGDVIEAFELIEKAPTL